MMSTKRRGLLPTILIATFMGQFDFFVVNVAAPSIQRELDASGAQLELVIAAYALTYAAGLITGGRMGDQYGRRPVFLAGLVAFTVTSLACGVAPTITLLVVARALQGIAAAVMLPQVLAFINTLIAPEGRAAAMGWFGVASGLGSIAGQALGGWLVQASAFGLGWRAVFLVNVPIMVVALIAAVTVLPRTKGPSSSGIDALGAAGLCLGMGLLVGGVTLTQHRALFWSVPTLVVGALVMALTARLENHRLAAGRPVTIDPDLFRIASLRAGSLASGAFMAYFASFMFVLTIALQVHCGLEPLHAGLLFLPSGVTFTLSSTIAPRTRIQMRPRLLLGCCLTLTGLVVAATATYTHQPTSTLPTWLCTAVTVTGLGNGLVLPALIGLSMRDVPPANAGMASGTITTIQQFTAALGVAILGAVFYATIGPGLHTALQITLTIQILLMVTVLTQCAKSDHEGRRA